MKWFQRHLNWTLILFGLVMLPVFAVLSIILGYFWAFLFAFVALPLPVGVWYLREKNRSLGWLLMLYLMPLGVVFFLCLKNRSERALLTGTPSPTGLF